MGAFCITCKYIEKDPHPGGAGNFSCRNPKVAVFAPVTGNSQTRCVWARSTEGKCEPSGIYWEPFEPKRGWFHRAWLGITLDKA
jgi:hypothetical protein